MNKCKNKHWEFKKYFLFLPVAALFLAAGIVTDSVYPKYSQVVNNALGKEVTADEGYVQKALSNSKDVNIRLQEEGSVLLKNENDILPLHPTTSMPINVYGILSAHHYIGGSGSGASNAVGVNLKTALEEDGFQVNETLWSFIESKELGYSTGSQVGDSIAGQYELSVSDYENAMSFTDAKKYSEYALVTFGTNGGEGADGDRGETNSLELGPNERALIERLDAEGFKIIVLINSSYVMELGPVIEHADAILWIGCTGLYGTYGISRLLSGKTNPSGRLVDTWMYEQETSSSYYTTNNINSFYTNNGTTIGAYTNYNEGIYVGYKWYETADAEGYWNGVSNSYGTGYEGVVAYPFGYGLSYTSFSEEIVVSSHKDDSIHFTIKVKNTGPVKGKDPIELYVSKPYDGNVEVSKVELVGFDKTKELNPGEEETIEVEVKDEYLASYDVKGNKGKGCYVLQGGNYDFFLASSTSGAHAWSMFSADSTRKASISLEEIVYSDNNKRTTDSVVATNQLEVTNNDTGISSTDTTAGYNELSRSGSFANAETAISELANQNGIVEISDDSKLYSAIKANYGSNTYKNFNTDHLKEVKEISDTSVEKEKQYMLEDLYTKDEQGNPLYEFDSQTGEKIVLRQANYNDSRWETLLSQMSLAEMEELIGRGGYGTIAIDSIGKKATSEYDGPTGISNFLKANLGITQETTGFCSEPIMAATWNKDLIEEFGEAVGMEANAFGNSGWYAPGMNIHRTPFGGRNGEYFSEDSYLTGIMGAQVAYGAFQKGVYTYAKHFAFNELEANREGGINCLLSEQAAREIYLRPFEIAIKEGKLTGLMSSFMCMNAKWNGGNFNLMNNIVRKEWNFHGSIITDLAGSSLMGSERGLCAGTDMMLSTSYSQNQRSSYLRCDTIKTMDDGIGAMKTAAKHILYAYVSAMVNREVVSSGVDYSGVTALFITLNVVLYTLTALCVGLFVWRLFVDLRNQKKLEGPIQESQSE